jgi:hypothetical protein
VWCPRQRALQDEPTAKCLGPVDESDQASSTGEVDSVAAVVANADAQPGARVVLGCGDRDRDGRGVGMFGDVGQGLGDQVVGGYLDLFG